MALGGLGKYSKCITLCYLSSELKDKKVPIADDIPWCKRWQMSYDILSICMEEHLYDSACNVLI